jgi:serine/threonine protein kinase
MPFTIGQNVGPYRILEQLGQGGMATVYKAYHPALDRFVAIKVLHPAFREDATFLARFTREARVVAKLEHPHIVPIFDFSECDNQPYLVMKYIEGETLKSRLTSSPMDAEEAIRIVEAIGSALEYAHSKGILHRDIKPSNILLTPDGNIYLADFGLARMAQSGEATLSSDMLMGTPHYISPEQAQGLKNLDSGTDIYSLGVVIYELAVGRVPYNADTPFSIIHDHIFTPLPLPRSINPKVPEGVERMLLKALAKDRKDRFLSVKDMVDAFVSATRFAVGKSNDIKTEIQPAGKTTPNGKSKASKKNTFPVGSKPSGAGTKSEKKRLPGWGWVLLACGSCLCLIAIAGVLINNADQKSLTRTQTAVENNALAETRMSYSAEPESTVLDSSIPADMQVAWKNFTAGMDLYQAGNKEEARKNFQTALDLIPASRASVILLATQRLAQTGEWQTAGTYCLKAVTANQNESAFSKICDEVFYRVAGEANGEAQLAQLITDHPDMPIANAAYGRWLIEHTDRMEEARNYLDTARGQNPGINISIIIRAILGEYQLYMKDIPNGINTLHGVVQDPNSPPWLKAEAQRLIKTWS